MNHSGGMATRPAARDVLLGRGGRPLVTSPLPLRPPTPITSVLSTYANPTRCRDTERFSDLSPHMQPLQDDTGSDPARA